MNDDAKEKFYRASFEMLVQLVDRIVSESGDPAGFDAREWSTRWANAPCRAFGGACPRDLLTSPEGRGAVLNIVRRMQSAAYS